MKSTDHSKTSHMATTEMASWGGAVSRMFAGRLAVFAALVVLASSATATTYTWKVAVSGSWEDPTMWNGGNGSDYPDDETDVASFPVGNYTVRLGNSLTILRLGTFNNNRMTLDLGGNTLTLANASSMSIYANHGTSPSQEPFATPVFTNGVLTITQGGVTMGLNGNTSVGGFTLDGVVSNIKSDKQYFYGSPRFIVKNGGVWNYPETRFYQYNRAGNGGFGFMKVTGEGSRLNFSSLSSTYGSCFNGYESGLYVQDGGEAYFSGRISVGGSALSGVQNFSTNSFIEVDSGTLTVEKDLLIGGYYNGNYLEHDKQYGPTLRVKGADSTVTIGEKLYLYDGVAAKIEYSVPSAGWGTAPVQAQSLFIRARNAEYGNCGSVSNIVSAFGWMARHPGETTPLLQLQTANNAGLAQLAANSLVEDYDGDLFVTQPVFDVSGDGKVLQLTAPDRIREQLLFPALTTACEAVAIDAERIALCFSTFGYRCESPTEVKVSLYGNAACEGEPIAVNVLDSSAMTDPTGTYTTTFEGLDLRNPYWAKVSAKNEYAKEATSIVAVSENVGAIPEFTVSRESQTLDSEQVSIIFSSFGWKLATLTEAKVCLYDNAACEGTAISVNTLDVSGMTDPTGTYTTTFDELDYRTVYGIRVYVKNSSAAEKTETLDFSTPGETGLTFTWKGGAGDFEDAAAWRISSTDATSYPTVNDIIGITAADTVITLRNDETIARIGTINSLTRPVIDLNGHSLLTTSSDSTFLLLSEYAVAENLETFRPTLTVRNGILGANVNFQVYNGSRPATGCVVFDNSRYIDGKLFYRVGNGFRVFVQNGSYVKLSSAVNNFAWEHDAAFSGYGFFCVRGRGSYFTTTYDNSGSSSFTVNGNHNALYVLDGAAATMTMALCIGGRNYSTNSFVEVDNASLTNKYDLAFGCYNNWGTWREFQYVDNPQLRIKGTDARVLVGGDLRIIDGISAEIRYTVPTNGFATTPLTANTLSVHDRNSEYESRGSARFVIDAKDWKVANPESSLTLLTLTTPNSAALQRLVGNATIHGSHCSLRVTDDGRSVVLTAPPRSGFIMVYR